MLGCGNPLGEKKRYSYAFLVASQGPSSHFSFEETSGTLAYNTGSSGINGTLTNSANISRGEIGVSDLSYTFSSNGYLVPTTPIPMAENWTISFWIKLPLPSNGLWKSCLRSATAHYVIFNNATNEFGSYVSGTFRPSGVFTNTLSAGWHHFATVGDSTSMAFYVDGSRHGGTTVGLTESVTFIGGNSSPQPCFSIDEVAIFDRALSDEEIALQASGL